MGHWQHLRAVFPSQSSFVGDVDLYLDIEALKEQFSDPKAKVFVLNNPVNPAGMAETSENSPCSCGVGCRRLSSSVMGYTRCSVMHILLGVTTALHINFICLLITLWGA